MKTRIDPKLIKPMEFNKPYVLNCKRLTINILTVNFDSKFGTSVQTLCVQAPHTIELTQSKHKFELFNNEIQGLVSYEIWACDAGETLGYPIHQTDFWTATADVEVGLSLDKELLQIVVYRLTSKEVHSDE